MDRRTLLKALPYCAACLAGGGFAVHRFRRAEPPQEPALDLDALAFDPLRDEGARPTVAGDQAAAPAVDRLQKIKEFDRAYDDDFVLEAGQMPVLESVSARIERAQVLVGHGNFNLLSLDQLLSFAHNYPDIGSFPQAEIDFLEEIFFADASSYGFYGEKVITNLTERVPNKDVVKIAGSGHYLLKGESLTQFERIRADIGDSITLTSGVRSLVKQYQLFLRKACETEGNLSQASRSLAPPGYSFHARGDFDLGKRGFGLSNFTEKFSETHEFRRLIDLGYISIRYTETNPFGVRHEPWHIKIA